MKKSLILLLVLGIASIATAGLSFTATSIDVLVGETVVIDIVTEQGGETASFMFDGGADIAGTTVYGSLGDFTELGSYPGYYNLVVADSSTSLGAGAVAATVSVNGDVLGASYNLFLSSDFYTPDGTISTITVNVVPEPITMGLLGLGGLFLRRRK